MRATSYLMILVMVFAISHLTFGQESLLNEQFAKARELTKQGKNAEASKAYTEMMGKFPGNKDVVKEWAMINMKRSPTGEEEMIGQLEELKKAYPQNTAILFWQMFLQAEHGQNEAALKTVEKLIVLQPDSGINYLGKGQILEAMNKPEEALAAYGKSVVLSPNNADAWQNKAGLLVKSGKYAEAIDCYTHAIQLAPKVPNFVYNRGCAYCLSGDKTNALADLAKAVSMDRRLLSHAPKDTDFKSLWEDPDFLKIVNQEKYPVPVRTADQKHGRAISQFWIFSAATINFAKSKGVSPYDVGLYIGNLFAPSWNPAGDFETMVRGALFNMESFRHVSDKPIQVKENPDGSVVMSEEESVIRKFLPDDNSFATFAEEIDFFRGLYEPIAARMGAAVTVENKDGMVVYTFRKKP